MKMTYFRINFKEDYKNVLNWINKNNIDVVSISETGGYYLDHRVIVWHK